jgi:hypothetical protein
MEQCILNMSEQDEAAPVACQLAGHWKNENFNSFGRFKRPARESRMRKAPQYDLCSMWVMNLYVIYGCRAKWTWKS